jgi:hypothetical protein
MPLMDELYKYNLKTTPELYKRTVDMYENNKDFLLIDVFEGEFKERIEKEYTEFIEKEKKILLHKIKVKGQVGVT